VFRRLESLELHIWHYSASCNTSAAIKVQMLVTIQSNYQIFVMNLMNAL
jgi:hypothetical protein